MSENTGTLYIYNINESYCSLDGDRSILMDCFSFFSFKVAGAEWTWAYKNKLWDGVQRLLSPHNFQFRKGLLPRIEAFAKAQGWQVIKDDVLKKEQKQFDAKSFIESLNLKLTFTPADYQIKAIQSAVDDDRLCVVSPTSSGKSFIIYVLMRYFLKPAFKDNRKILVTEPTVKLVHQMFADWQSYDPAYPLDKVVHKICEGETKNTHKPVVLSTWQSLTEMSRKNKKTKKVTYRPIVNLGQFYAIMCDEVHLMEGDSVQTLLDKATSTKYKFGFTGTLKDKKGLHQLIIEGLTGIEHKTTTTKELMERGIVSKLIINAMILNYSQSVKDMNKKAKWHDETDFIVNYQPRNDFIANLVASLPKGENTLILTEYHDKKPHCDILARAIRAKCPDKKIIVVHGGTNEDSEEVRKFVENNEDVVIIATFGVYSTGISINNIQNLIFATFSKSIVKVLQSLGRGLRRDGKKNILKAFDLVDSFGKDKQNHLVKHFLERVKIYISEGFSIKQISINI